MYFFSSEVARQNTPALPPSANFFQPIVSHKSNRLHTPGLKYRFHYIIIDRYGYTAINVIDIWMNTPTTCKLTSCLYNFINGISCSFVLLTSWSMLLLSLPGLGIICRDPLFKDFDPPG